ncbi:MAG: hypothetical protein ACOY4R_17810 [Pseudomonadota bacterium]
MRVDKTVGWRHNASTVRTLRSSLAAAALLAAVVPATAQAALDRARFEAALIAARDYADDRSLLFYCLRGSVEQVPFLYAGLQTDLEQTVQKMKSAGASARQTAEVVQAVLVNVRFYDRNAKDASLDRRCIAKDVERSRAQASGVSVPLFQRAPFDKFGR